MSDAAPVVPVDAPADAPEAPTTPTDTLPKAEAKPPTPAEVRRYKVKIDGQESEVPEDELIRGYQRASAASRRLEEAAKARKELDERAAKLKADPWAFLKETAGLDPDQLAIQRVQKLMEQEAMTEEQRRFASLQAEKEAAEARAKQLEEAQKTQAQAQAQARAAEQINTVIPAAAEKAGLPRAPVVGRMMLDYMMSAARANPHAVTSLEDLASDAAEYARETLASWRSGTTQAMSEQQLIEFVGVENAKRIATFMASQARSTLPGAATPPPRNVQPQKPKGPPVLTTDEWRERYG